MDAIVTAGGIPQPKDPLYAYSNGSSKALIDLAGKPMIQWVLDALNASQQVENIIVIGLSAKSGLTSKKPLYYLSNQGRMLANIVAGVGKAVELHPKNQHVLIVSSDVPTLKGEMVDWLVETAMQTKDEIYYGVCPREVMEARFPTSNRTYTQLSDMEVCGADVNIIHVNQVTQHLDTWEALIGNRKSPLRQAAVIGWGTLYRLWRKQFTLEELVQRASERIGVKGRAILWDHAEPCMDVDKPHQLEILRADLAKQLKKKPASTPKAAPAKTIKKAATSKAKPKKR
ncbi:MAG: nucleotidyltransferase family protein [Anaerolineales bacterium]|nr:nucleotidyltransferase family protein [Anaerolineales bacterium]